MWSEEEKAFIRRLSSTLTDIKLAKAFTIKFKRETNTEQIRKYRQRLGIKKCPGRGVCIVKENTNEH